MREIPLTQNKVALVDDKDYEEISKYKWHAYKGRTTYYAARMSQSEHKRRHSIRMHVAILGTPKGMDTDHINGNGLDNRRENLRIVTKRQNSQNLHIKKSGRFTGVSWHNQGRKWRARIKVNGKTHHLGLYDSDEAAALRYKIACDWQVMEIVGAA